MSLRFLQSSYDANDDAADDDAADDDDDDGAANSLVVFGLAFVFWSVSLVGLLLLLVVVVMAVSLSETGSCNNLIMKDKGQSHEPLDDVWRWP